MLWTLILKLIIVIIFIIIIIINLLPDSTTPSSLLRGFINVLFKALQRGRARRLRAAPSSLMIESVRVPKDNETFMSTNNIFKHFQAWVVVSLWSAKWVIHPFCFVCYRLACWLTCLCVCLGTHTDKQINRYISRGKDEDRQTDRYIHMHTHIHA